MFTTLSMIAMFAAGIVFSIWMVRYDNLEVS